MKKRRSLELTICNHSSTSKLEKKEPENGNLSSNAASPMTVGKRGEWHYILIGVGEVETFHQSNHDLELMCPALLGLWNGLAELLLLSLRILDHELDLH